MEWIATAVAVVAALMAGWQAWEARRSRHEARSSASEAQQHEERAAAASERIASAIEEQNARERAAAERESAERERYRNPWTIEPQAAASRAWKFVLGGDEPVTGVALTFDRDHNSDRLDVNIPESGTMRPGQSFRLDWWRGLQSSQQVDAELHWTRPNGQQHRTLVTLD